MKKLTDHLQDFHQKRVIVRANYDVPIENNQVQDTTRIESSVDTIKALLSVQATITLIAHAGRPDGHYQSDSSLRPIVSILENLLGQPLQFIDYVKDLSTLNQPTSPISLLENLRFWNQEEANEPDFARYLATLGDLYVNEAFANCHRAHASIVGIPKLLPSYAGVSLSEELETMDEFITNPKQPLVLVLGGAKLETKEPLINAFVDKATHILVGGKIAVDIHKKNLHYPDNVIIADLKEDTKDITPESAHRFAEIIASAGSVIWNGTMGIFEEPEHQQGTAIVAKAVNSTTAKTLVGGGDTETALTLLDQEANIDFISTGGGAMLTYLSSQPLPGIEALNSQ